MNYPFAFAEAALCAEIAVEISAVHALALFAVFHAEVKSVDSVHLSNRRQNESQQ